MFANQYVVNLQQDRKPMRVQGLCNCFDRYAAILEI